MVNYRRVLCEVALLSVFVALASSAPTYDDVDIHYDQRQNGTENVRVNLDGFAFAVVPAEPLFAALGGVGDLMDLVSLEDFNGSYKPKPPSSTTTSSSILEGEKPQEKPQEAKPDTKPEAYVKPEETKPDVPANLAEASPLSDVSLNDGLKIQKKEVYSKKQESAKRVKNRLAAFLLPLLQQARNQRKFNFN